MKTRSENGSKGSEKAERKCRMLKRVMAWVLLIGFVLLLLNIAIFHFYWQVSLAVYVVIIIFFVLSNGKIVPEQTEAGHNPSGGNNNAEIPDTAGEGIDTEEDSKDNEESNYKENDKESDKEGDKGKAQ